MKVFVLLSFFCTFRLGADESLLPQINGLLKKIEFAEKFVSSVDPDNFSSLITEKSYYFTMDVSSVLHIREHVLETRSTPFFANLTSEQEFEYLVLPRELHVDNIGVSSWSWGGRDSLFYVFVRCRENRFCVQKSSTDREKEQKNLINSFELRIESGGDSEKARILQNLLQRFLYGAVGKKWEEKSEDDDDFGIYWNPEPDDADDFNPLY
jgi:hypothetical protein